MNVSGQSCFHPQETQHDLYTRETYRSQVAVDDFFKQLKLERKAAAERTARYRAKHKDKYHGTHREGVAKWRRENPETYREQHLKRKYGITLAEHDAMLTLQGNCCAGCSGLEPGGKGTWHVDHCHDTGKVRGLLCRGCNAALGLVKDSPETLRKLALYLEQNK